MLKVLSIVNNDYEYGNYFYYGDHMPSLSLPQSTWSLANLRTLCLSNWKLGNVSFLIYLTTLVVLDLRVCYIEVLPEGMEKLTKLKLLHLSDCIFSHDFDCEAISCCSQLEELYFYGNKYPSKGRVEAILALPNLQRFVILFKFFKDVDFGKSIRVLHLPNFNMLHASEHNLLHRAYEISLEYLHGGCKNIIPDMVRVVGGMKELMSLRFSICSEIECLIDTTDPQTSSLQVGGFLPMLVKLDLLDLKNLVELCRGPPLLTLGFFEKLERLSIYRCMQLKNIFPEACNLYNLKILNIGMNSSSREYTSEYYKWTSFTTLFSMPVTRSLQQLEELCIQGCVKLEHITSGGGEDSTNIGDSSHLMFPKLKKLYIWNCPKLEFVLPASFVQHGILELQEIKICHGDGLKYVFGQYDHEVHSSHQNQTQVVLPSLKIFKLNYHRNLLGICPERFHLMCPSLEELEWKDCPKLCTSGVNLTIGLKGKQHLDKERQSFWSNTATPNELCKQRLSIAASQFQVFHMKNCSAEGIFQMQVEGELSSESERKPLNSNLHYLELDDLLELRFIWNISKFMRLNNLKFVSIVNCPKLKTIFSPCIVRCLPMLETIYIWNCEELEEIMPSHPENKQLEKPNACPQQQVCFPRLETFDVNGCKKLKCLFYDSKACHFPELQSLAIKECRQLKQLLGFESAQREGVGEIGVRILFPKLRKLALRSLPIFSEISPLFDVQRRMHTYSVVDCPKYNSSYSV